MSASHYSNALNCFVSGLEECFGEIGIIVFVVVD
jgi:hypothetical protein